MKLEGLFAKLSVGLVSVLWTTAIYFQLPEAVDLTHLLRLGANYVPLTTEGQWFRLLSQNFIVFDSLQLLLTSCVLILSSFLMATHRSVITSLIVVLFLAVSTSLVSVLFLPKSLFFGPQNLLIALVVACCGLPFFSKFKVKDLILLLANLMAAVTCFYLQGSSMDELLFPVLLGAFAYSLMVGVTNKDFLRSLGIAAIIVAVLMSFTKKRFNYFPIIKNFQVEQKECLEKSLGFLSVTNNQKDRRMIERSLNMLSSVVRVSCHPAISKLRQLDRLMSEVPNSNWSATKNELLLIRELTRAETHILKSQQLFSEYKKLLKNRDFSKILELKSLIKHDDIKKTIASIKKLDHQPLAKIKKRKLAKLVKVKEFHVSLEKNIAKIKSKKSSEAGAESTTAMIKRFNEYESKCKQSVDDIEFGKKHIYIDFVAELEVILKESCRPALFLTDKLIRKYLKTSSLARWKTARHLVKQRIWKLHVAKEVVTLSEVESKIDSLAYEGDWQQIKRYQNNNILNHINSIGLLMKEFEPQFGRRAGLRDKYVFEKLTETLAGYKGLSQRISAEGLDRRPAGE